MEYTLVMGLFDVTIVPGKLSGSRRFYAGKKTRYYVHGAVARRRDAALTKMLSHAYEQGETLSSVSKWTD